MPTRTELRRGGMLTAEQLLHTVNDHLRAAPPMDPGKPAPSITYNQLMDLLAGSPDFLDTFSLVMKSDDDPVVPMYQPELAAVVSQAILRGYVSKTFLQAWGPRLKPGDALLRYVSENMQWLIPV